VLGHVGQRLLRDAQQRDLDLGVQALRVPGGGDRGADAVHRGPAIRHLGQRLRQLGVLQRLRAHSPDRAPRLGQALAGQPSGVADPPLPVGLAGAAVRTAPGRLGERAQPGLLGGFQLSDDAGQALRQGVVDLPRHPLPFLQHARLPGLDEQLGVQAGVLGHHRLELTVRLGQVDDDPLAFGVLILGFLAQMDEHGHQHRVQAGHDGEDSQVREGRRVESAELRDGRQGRDAHQATQAAVSPATARVRPTPAAVGLSVIRYGTKEMTSST